MWNEKRRLSIRVHVACCAQSDYTKGHDAQEAELEGSSDHNDAWNMKCTVRDQQALEARWCMCFCPARGSRGMRLWSLAYGT